MMRMRSVLICHGNSLACIGPLMLINVFVGKLVKFFFLSFATGFQSGE